MFVKLNCGEGNGNPFQYCCLENSVDRGAWWAAVHGVTQSQTRLKWLRMHACIGEGNGNPLQYSCLENPRDGGAWWAAVYGVAQSRTRLKQLSCSKLNWTELKCNVWAYTGEKNKLEENSLLPFVMKKLDYVTQKYLNERHSTPKASSCGWKVTKAHVSLLRSGGHK